MSDKELRAGDFVTTGVRLVRPLAEGGMGRVWIAEHIGLQSQVVVKLMAKEMAARDDGASRFAREAAIAAAIKSPHVVQVFDHGVTAEHGVPYIVMELLEGRDLGAMLHERGRLEPSEAIAIVVQTGKALAKAHKADIVHRDVKPENIFLCAQGEGEGDGDGEGDALQVKLLDFGTAKQSRATSATIPGEIMGTPYYMSPEQSVGAMVNERSDIWSLGVVAFEMLTGTKPFDGPNVGAIALAIHGKLPRISERANDLPPALDDWFARACAQVPQDRFASMRELTTSFIEAITGAAPVLEATESICLPLRRISVRPAAAMAEDDLRKTLPTSIEPSIPPPPPEPELAVANAFEDEPMPVSLLDSIAPLTASLPDRLTVHRPTKIAATVVGFAAAALMAAIVFHHPAGGAVAGGAPGVAAPLPPPAVGASRVGEPSPVEAPPAVVAAGDLPSAVASPPVSPHKKVAKKGLMPPLPSSSPSPASSSVPKKEPGKKGAPPKVDEDLVRLIEADPTQAAASASKPGPVPAPVTPPAPVLPAAQ